MPKKELDLGRLAMRREGNTWNAYYADGGSMDGAVFLGSVCIAGVQTEERRRAFMDMMRGIIDEIIKDAIGAEPSWKGETDAPEHERAGHG